MRSLVMLVAVVLLVSAAAAEPVEDRAALLAFLNGTLHQARVNWTEAESACDWVGITCDAAGDAVVELHLPAVGLVGAIPSSTIGRLTALRVLSLRSNAIAAPLPADLANLTLLRSFYLQDNNISGDLPTAITALLHLTHLDLSGNSFSGEIPAAINSLTLLVKLYLDRNRFSGTIPSIGITSLSAFNVSHNMLNGSIPKSLERFPESSFAGNLNLCGGPLQPCTPFFPSPAPSPGEFPSGSGRKKSGKLSTAAIIGISIAGGMALLLILLLLLICLTFRRKKRGGAKAVKREAEAMGTPSTSKEESTPQGEKSPLVFVGKGGGFSFDLEDLLRASAEVLGKGSMGTSYKAILEDGTTVVVKRLKDVIAGRREFESHIQTLGNVAPHPNVLPIRAYYYSKDEKLLVTDYHPAGSLSSLLHGSRGSGQTPLDWESRMHVALSVARGLGHLHSSATLPHGNIKSSNILLHRDPSSVAVSDYSLFPLFDPAAAPPPRAAGYRAPEFVETRRPSFKTDVYSFGVLLLELLTGRAPNQAAGVGEDGLDLPRWVQSMLREEWTAEVFDSDLMRYPGAEEEMVGFLQVGMACVATMPDSRPDMADVVKMIEDVMNARGEIELHSSDEHIPHVTATP